MTRIVPWRAQPWALAGCLLFGAVACGQENTPAEVLAPAPMPERPVWKPPPPPPQPVSCGAGCLQGKGSTVVRFQMAGGDHTAAVAVDGNEGLFSVGPPINISESVTNWSGNKNFFNSAAGVYRIEIRATGNWTLNVVKGRQTFADE